MSRKLNRKDHNKILKKYFNQPNGVIPFTRSKTIGKNNLLNMVYIIEHIETKSYYIGLHTANDNDILDRYTTSSKLINKIIQVQGIESLRIIDVIYCYTRSSASKIEQLLIKGNFNDYSNLNMAYVYNGKTVCKKLDMIYFGVKSHSCNFTKNNKIISNSSSVRLWSYSKPTSNLSFFNSPEWYKVRGFALEKCKYTCSYCVTKTGDGIAMHVKHIVPMDIEPKLALEIDNLHVVCELHLKI